MHRSMRPAPSPPAAFELRRDIAGEVLLQRLLPLLINPPGSLGVRYVWPAGWIHLARHPLPQRRETASACDPELLPLPLAIRSDRFDHAGSIRPDPHLKIQYPHVPAGRLHLGRSLRRFFQRHAPQPTRPPQPRLPRKVVIIPRVGPLQSFIPLCHAILCRVNTQTAVT